jgi:hypothetical protein
MPYLECYDAGFRSAQCNKKEMRGSDVAAFGACSAVRSYRPPASCRRAGKRAQRRADRETLHKDGGWLWTGG